MEKSNREVISGNIDLIYRIKKFQFSNKFSMTNTKIKNPIVDFSEYAAANPYYKKRDEEGNIGKWLENNDYTKAANPLWNASQNSRDEGKQLALSNYFVAEYTPLEALKVRARFGISYATTIQKNSSPATTPASILMRSSKKGLSIPPIPEVTNTKASYR